MAYALAFVVLIALIAGPGLWARHVLERHGRDEYFSGTGIDLARILVRDLNLTDVRVETTELGDHYDPRDKVVRLNPVSSGKRSLTAVVVAAHEVGHALQDQSGDGLLRFRTSLVMFGVWAERIGAAAIMIAPLLGAALQVPLIGRMLLVAAVLVLGIPVLIHLVTLPVELDASFNRALPLLRTGKYIPQEDERAARKILTACALTYLAQALASMFNILRWARIFRR
ncbi:MAG: zinc metallopeptidase [Desulfomicrobium sp.]|nr:zinc metallopeptidase [Pseudomonadota bacterium]MBV1713657.1 zinc metallopeptidase [Desulfomicrobium sp.]MBU4572193.1 zinc metallopeptidase [Pseudomonadota bacterium]MBU4594171.1 zinc metallopeptidase [Pseudomonadota bacterium]MBV1720878.1 zinc metallopeptidase [Desulfomicrobium sp.]